jgi:hypothetical protein
MSKHNLTKEECGRGGTATSKSHPRSQSFMDWMRNLPQSKLAYSEAGKRAAIRLNIPSEAKTRRCQAAGKINGENNVLSGELAGAREHCDYARQAGWRAHLYWHIRRDVFQPKCDFCTGIDPGYIFSKSKLMEKG